MTKEELNGIWNYYLSIEKDIENTSKYIEPKGQENVYSFEFAKILILSCTEVESVFKNICFEIKGKPCPGNIGEYKNTILGKYPQIVDAEVAINRWGRKIKPFEEWKTGSLSWWSAYQEIKHSRGAHFDQATYLHAVTALSALYLSVFYLSKLTGIAFQNSKSEYVDSDYADTHLLCAPPSPLPGFENGFFPPDIEPFEIKKASYLL